jgi:large subunit ribosomal protein L24
MPEKSTVKKSQAKLHIRKGDRVKASAARIAGWRQVTVYPERNRDRRRREHRQAPSARYLCPPQARQTTKGGIVPPSADPRLERPAGRQGLKGDEVVTRVGYDRVEVTKRRPDGSESTRSVRIASCVTGEEI